jgi:hypothetical protein
MTSSCGLCSGLFHTRRPARNKRFPISRRDLRVTVPAVPDVPANWLLRFAPSRGESHPLRLAGTAGTPGTGRRNTFPAKRVAPVPASPPLPGTNRNTTRVRRWRRDSQTTRLCARRFYRPVILQRGPIQIHDVNECADDLRIALDDRLEGRKSDGVKMDGLNRHGPGGSESIESINDHNYINLPTMPWNCHYCVNS